MSNTTGDVLKPLPEACIQRIVWTLLSLLPIVGMAVDLIAPSLPAIASGLQVPSSVAKNVIAVYLLGYALGNFVTGFLTDAFGRQKLLRANLLGFVLVSLIPVFFPHLITLLLARLLQGITIGAAAVLIRAIYSDILTPERIVRMGILTGTMWGIGPVIGPVIGGYLQVYFGWQAGFWFFAIITFFIFILVFLVVPETQVVRHSLNIKTIRKNCLEVVKHRLFMAMALLMGLTYSLMITFNTIGPFLIQTRLHHSPVFFGHLALCLGLLFLMGTFVCRYLIKQHELKRIFAIAINSFFLIALLGLLVSYVSKDSLTLIILISLAMFFACGLIYPVAMGKGVSLFRHVSGTSTAIMYLINVLLTSFTAFLVSFINVQNTISLMWVYATLLALCVVVYWFMVKED